MAGEGSRSATRVGATWWRSAPIRAAPTGGVELFGIDGREEARLSPTGFGPPPADEIDEIDDAAVPQDPSPR